MDKGSNRMQPEVEPHEEPLSCTITVTRLPRDGLPVRFEASEEEREVLARFLAIPAVERLSAEMRATPWRSGGVSVKGRLTAVAVQESVVTLEPVSQEIDEPVDLIFVPEQSKLSRIRGQGEGEIHLDPEGEDIPDTFSGDRIDLGASLREILTLALDPYPREAGAEFEGREEEAEEERRPSPFAALARLGSKGN